jgi:hypothetical protein
MGNRSILAATSVLSMGWLAGCGAEAPGYAGDEELTGEVTNALAPAPVTTIIGPTGPGNPTTPTYSWGAVATATSYDVVVYLNSPITRMLDTNFTALEAGCDAGPTCAVTPFLPLPNNNYSWWVRSRNSDGPAFNWSVETLFTVDAPSNPPSAPTMLSPSGTLGTTTPTFSWTASTNRPTTYTLSIRGVTPDVVYSAADAGCDSDNTCAVTPGTALPAWSHKFWVRATNVIGPGAWSAASSFQIVVAGSTPILTAPSGTVTDSTPTYLWTGVAGATQYQLWVTNPSSNATPIVNILVTAADAGCAADVTCEFTPATALGNFASAFFVKATAGVTSAWSGKRSFTVNAP